MLERKRRRYSREFKLESIERLESGTILNKGALGTTCAEGENGSVFSV